jgi:hypothetical protein
MPLNSHAWSPDSTIVPPPTERGKIHAVDVPRRVTRLTDHDINDYQPVYSTDGTQILLISETASMIEGVIEFHVMNADGSDLHPLGDGEIFKGDLTIHRMAQVAYMSMRVIGTST